VWDRSSSNIGPTARDRLDEPARDVLDESPLGGAGAGRPVRVLSIPRFAARQVGAGPAKLEVAREDRSRKFEHVDSVCQILATGAAVETEQPLHLFRRAIDQEDLGRNPAFDFGDQVRVFCWVVGNDLSRSVRIRSVDRSKGQFGLPFDMVPRHVFTPCWQTSPERQGSENGLADLLPVMTSDQGQRCDDSQIKRVLTAALAGEWARMIGLGALAHEGRVSVDID
jgi:hypothetical protein